MYNRECTGPFRTACPLILASASPRRKELLEALGMVFSIEVSRAEEPPPGPGDLPGDYANSNACMKADDVAKRFPEAAVLGADTVVVLDGEILGKPSGMEHAVDMLSHLCGRRHTVITGCCLVMPGGESRKVFSGSTDVWMAGQAPEIIRAYVAGREPLDKAGSYAVQGCGAFMVQRLEGSCTNVVGLPMEMVVSALLEGHVLSVR